MRPGRVGLKLGLAASIRARDATRAQHPMGCHTGYAGYDLLQCEYAVESKNIQIKSLSMTGFKPRISGVGSDRSTN